MQNTNQDLHAQVEALRDALRSHPEVQVEAGVDMPVVHTPRKKLLELMRELQGSALAFKYCSLVTAIDHMGNEPRYEVVYALYSFQRNEWVRVKTRCGEFDARVPSVAEIWPGANWMERECYDMFGIEFEGHPDLRRILMPEGYLGHPLRKDFPRDGLEPDQLYREWDRERRQEEGL